MQPYLDMRSLFFMASFIGLVLSLCMLYVSSTRRVYPGFHCWTAASFLYFLGNILTGLRDVLPVFISIILSNFLFISVFLLVPCGLSHFADNKFPLRSYLTALIIFLAPFFYFTYVTPSIIARIIIISAVVSICGFYSMTLFRRRVVPILKRSNFLFQASLLTITLWSIVRGIFTIWMEGRVESYLLSSSIQGISIIIYCTGFVSGCFSFFIINFQMLELEHSNVSAELQSVKDFIPICAYCKKIRDDQGYWDQIEAYLVSHSDVAFSHSICPDCFAKHCVDESE